MHWAAGWLVGAHVAPLNRDCPDRAPPSGFGAGHAVLGVCVAAVCPFATVSKHERILLQFTRRHNVRNVSILRVHT
jgi:hypothetical protein